MARRDQYSIGEATITKAAAANFIAEALVEGRERRAAFKRIHGRIAEAQSKGDLPSRPAIPAGVLFGWAVEQKGLAKLRDIPSLPISVSITVSSPTLEAQVGTDVSGVPAPRKIRSLRPMYTAAVQELEAAQREISKLSATISAKQQKELALSSIRSESGRQGGRGNER